MTFYFIFLLYRDNNEVATHPNLLAVQSRSGFPPGQCDQPMTMDQNKRNIDYFGNMTPIWYNAASDRFDNNYYFLNKIILG